MAKLIPGVGENKPNKKRRLIVGIVIGVVALAAAGTAWYLITQRPHLLDGVSADDEKLIEGDTRSRSTTLAILKAHNQSDAGDIDGAAATLNAAIPKAASTSERVDLYGQLSSIYSDNNRRQDATDAINAAIKLEPDNWNLYKRLGLIDETFGDIDGAKAQYAKADEVLKKTPDYDTYHDSLETLIRQAGTDQ